ncbi:MAG: BamA/TamA family outer membrane protein, partial [Bacteroidota bacterium]
ERLAIVVVDSYWWLSDWDKEPKLNDGCESKSRFVFNFLFEEMVRKNRNKNVIIAMHHPLYSGGDHGGYYTAKEHFFPLSRYQKNLLLPLPGLGSLAAFLRSSIGGRNDLAHPTYRDMKKKILAGAKKNGQFIFASAHEYSLQYIQEANQHFVISGSGARQGAAKLVKGSEFAAGKAGFAQLDFHTDGAAYLTFWGVDENDEMGKVLFKKRIKDQLPMATNNTPQKFEEYEQQKDSIATKLLTTKVTKKGFIHHTLLGKHYREVYLPDYKFPVLDLATFKGGMTPIKRGGGNQTNSLRLANPDGQQYVMRSMTKDASRFIPYPFNKITGTQAFVEDNFLSTHPFAAIVLPPLADVANIYHTNPQLYYIPKQPVLAENNDLFGGEVYLVEERAAKDWSNLESFGFSKKMVSTPDVVDKLLKNGKHFVDQQWTVRTRLFDELIGDWDRHDDQWRWASFKDEAKDRTLYRPVPRDRDQPFCKYDGFMVSFARLTLPFIKQLRPYSPDIKNIKWSNYNARQFDRAFLNEVSWKVWEAEIQFLQKVLTDEVIENAFRQTWPEPAHRLSAPEIMEFMKARRDNLATIGRKHYLLLAKEVDVFGTRKKDRFEVERLNDRETRVRVYRLRNKGQEKDPIYERIFYTNETKEVRLYGLNGDDEFHIVGEAAKGILIRAIGGLGEDRFVDQSKVEGPSKKTKIYDTEEGNLLEVGQEAKDLTSNRREQNIYNRKDFHYEYDFVMPLPFIGFNPDDGLFLGTNLTFVDYKFKKDPYNATHTFAVNFAFATKAFNLDYSGDFLDALGRWDILLNATYRSPQFVNNFFGLGNESQYIQDGATGIDFYRVRQRMFEVNPNLKRRFAGGNGAFILGPVFQRTRVEQTEGRFISSEDSNLPATIFENQNFAGLRSVFQYENVDDLNIPRRGILFYSGVDWMADLAEAEKRFARLSAEMTMYISLGNKESVILASKIGTEHLIGTFEFFQAARLDGLTNFRGFRADRFYGRTSFYHQNDLRIKLLTSANGIVPFSFGVTGGFDHGRVWADDLPSDRWHYSYGGSLWIAPVDFIVISAGLYHSREQNQLLIGFGFGF